MKWNKFLIISLFFSFLALQVTAQDENECGKSANKKVRKLVEKGTDKKSYKKDD